jgi:arsenical pump membrane protein
VTLACVRLANSASLLLPVSNLTNLLAVPSIPLSFLGFAALMGPVWVVAICVEYVGQRLFFRAELAPRSSEKRPHVEVRMPRVPLVVLVVMLAGFAAASPVGIAPAWVAAAAAVVLAAYARARGRLSTRQLLHATHAPFAAFVLCLGIVVAALAHGFLRGVLRAVLPTGASFPELLLVAVVAMVLANVVNNLPATLLLVPLVAPLGVLPVLAALIGLDVGSNLTYVGSLANLLWSRGLYRAGMPPSARTFHLLSAYLTLPVLVCAVLALWLVGRTGLAG